MENLKDVFEVVKANKLIEHYTKIKPGGGIKHRLAGIGTNEKDKKNGLTDDDVVQIKAGLKQLVSEINGVIENI